MTEMDFTVLAIVTQKGPLSAYDIRKEFAGSLTPTWSSSTGSVYPSCRRLIAAGLVRESAPAGARSRKRLRATPAGGHAVSTWLTRVTPEIATATPDPIRTRMYFLDLLGGEEREQLIRDARRLTEEAIAIAMRRLEERSNRQPAEWEQRAAHGVLYELRARRKWLRWLAERSG